MAADNTVVDEERRRKGTSRIVARVCVVTPALIVLAFGFAKLLDVPEFIRELATWTLIPRRALMGMGLTVPVLEIAVSGAVVLGLGGKTSARALLLLLIGFTVFFGIHAYLGVHPTCGCAGVIGKLAGWRDEARWLLVRNAVIIATLLIGMLLGSLPTIGDPLLKYGK